MATTFGTRPEDVVQDSKGNSLSGVVLTLYASKADALAQTSPVGASTSDDGLWPFSDTDSRTALWVRDPAGHVWAVESEGATVADFTDQVNAAQAAAEAAQAAAVTAAGLVGAPADAAVAALINSSSTTRSAADTRYPQRTGVPVSVKDPAYGATGNGSTDDTSAIMAAITAAAGRTVYFPAGTYLVDATANVGNSSHAVGLKLTVAGTRLLLDKAATIKVKPNSAIRYSAIEVTAADCTIEGGTILGDVGTHTGGTGEWGYGIDINTGGDRCTVRGVRATKCWGDGIVIGDGSSFSGGAIPADVRIIDVTCDDNRRNGLSIIAAARPQVIGGSFINTGLTAFTSPGAGIAVEPNSGGTQSVTDAVISGATCTGNKGRGLFVHGQGNTCSGTSIGVIASGNLADGFAADSSTTRWTFQSCIANGNTGVGFSLPSTLGPVELMGCKSVLNTFVGYSIASTRAVLTGCIARDNGRDGFYVDVLAVTPQLIGCSSVGNCTAGNASWIREFEVFCTDALLQGCIAEVGVNTNKATIGFAVRSGATTGRLLGCSTRGTFATAAYQGQADTATFPVPGVAKAAAITAPNAQTAAYVQADVTSLKTAIDAIRTALTNHGITS